MFVIFGSFYANFQNVEQGFKNIYSNFNTIKYVELKKFNF